MNTEIKNAVAPADDKAQYDEYAKRLLAQKDVLAHILVKTVNEFKDMNPKDVVQYIEGEPYISVVPVEPGLTNSAGMVSAEQGDTGSPKTDGKGKRIVGLNTENSDINEGLIRFDIIFYVRMKDGLSKIIINVEAQKDVPDDYKILNRAVFYVSRLVSSQKERDFINTNYDDIKQVFSIWICMNMDNNIMSHIHLTKDELLEPYNWEGNIDLLNIVLIGITNELPKHDKRYELHRLITALLSDKLETSQKYDILENEYDIVLNDDLRKDVNVMCNLGQGIEDRTNEKVVWNMYKKGYTLDEIAEVVEISVDEVEKVIKMKEKYVLV